MEKLGLNTRTARKEIVKKVNLERLKNNPVILTDENICEIFLIFKNYFYLKAPERKY